MKIHHEPIPDVDRYINKESKLTLEDKLPQFERYLRFVGRARKIDEKTRILEIGTGTGWFPILCKAKGLQCKGLEISPQLVEVAMETGRKVGVVPDIQLGNIEDGTVGSEQYDVIIASSVFEHVEHWRGGLKKAYDALRPGGVFFFESTNKFSFTSGEWPLPMYGWMPDPIRYRFRMMKQGKDIMKLGIDFNQFRYPLLRREFRKLGYRTIYDVIDIVDIDRLSGFRRNVVSMCRKNALVKRVVLTFHEATAFICVK